MKKIILLLCTLSFVFSCSDFSGIDTSDENPAEEGYVNWEIAKIGDTFNVSKITNATSTTIDISDLGVGLDGGTEGPSFGSRVYIKYIASTITDDNIDIDTNNDKYWDAYQTQTTKTTRFYDAVQNSSATAYHADGTVDFTVPIMATNIKFNAFSKDFVLKGINDGTGDVIVVGITTYTDDGRPPVSEGDVDFNTPMQ